MLTCQKCQVLRVKEGENYSLRYLPDIVNPIAELSISLFKQFVFLCEEETDALIYCLTVTFRHEDEAQKNKHEAG